MNTPIFWFCANVMFLVTRALTLKSGTPRALPIPSGAPSAALRNRLPSPLGFAPLICVYGRAEAAVIEGDRSKPYGRLNTPATVIRWRSSYAAEERIEGQIAAAVLQEHVRVVGRQRHLVREHVREAGVELVRLCILDVRIVPVANGALTGREKRRIDRGRREWRLAVHEVG